MTRATENESQSSYAGTSKTRKAEGRGGLRHNKTPQEWADLTGAPTMTGKEDAEGQIPVRNGNNAQNRPHGNNKPETQARRTGGQEERDSLATSDQRGETPRSKTQQKGNRDGNDHQQPGGKGTDQQGEHTKEPHDPPQTMDARLTKPQTTPTASQKKLRSSYRSRAKVGTTSNKVKQDGRHKKGQEKAKGKMRRPTRTSRNAEKETTRITDRRSIPIAIRIRIRMVRKELATGDNRDTARRAKTT